MRIAKFLLAASFAITATAQDKQFAGELFDAANHACSSEAGHSLPAGTCPVSLRTTEFGITAADGKFIKFDEGGNEKAKEALPKSKKGSQTVIAYWKTGKTSGKVMAHVMGTLTADTLNVTSVKID